MSNVKEVFLPDLGDFAEVDIIEVLVNPGDRVEAEESILTLESEKATMEIPAPEAGVITELKVAVGDKVSQGQLIALMEVEGDASEEATETESSVERESDNASRQVEPEPAPQPEQAAQDTTEPQEELKEIHLPDIGDFKEVEVIEVLVSAGDRVEAEESILTLESEKATMEIPAPFAGVVEEIKVAVGDKVSQDHLIALLRTNAAPGAVAVESKPAELEPEPTVPVPAKMPSAEPAPRAAGEKEAKPRPVIAKPSDAPQGHSHASPSIRRFARELGVDLMMVKGSGRKGRVTKDDVQDYVKQALAAQGTAAQTTGGALPFALPTAPDIDFSQFGEIEESALGRIKKISGPHLHRAWLSVPHVTQFDEADITELEAFRKSQKDAAAKQDLKLTFMPFLMKALAKALAKYPQVNSSLSPDGDKLILKKYVNIGIAVDTPNGLLVPVVKDVDKKGVFELAGDLMAISDKARQGKLGPSDLQGGCMSISSLGGIGGTQFTPIVNSPEVAILGVSRAEMKPKWNGEGFEPRLMMPYSLSYDHRVIDGAEGVRFTTYLSGLLGDIRTLLL